MTQPLQSILWPSDVSYLLLMTSHMSFTKDMKLNMKKGTFLSNSTNKQQFINVLSYFLERNCKVYYALGDADVMIAQKAVELARVADTVLVGDDTVLLVLLCYYACLQTRAQESHYETQGVEQNCCQRENWL